MSSVANRPLSPQECGADGCEDRSTTRQRAAPIDASFSAQAAWVVDDTTLPKKGDHSVGVARQYCAPLGKQDNCQVAVTVSLANASMSVPCAYRLYLPESWARQRPRRR